MRPINLKSINFDRLLAIFGCVAGVVALLLSWEANNIARQDITPRVVVITTDSYGGPLTNFSAPANAPSIMGFECFQNIRLTNLGGARTDIVGYEAIIHFKQDSISASSNKPIVYINRSLDSRISDLAIVLLNEEGENKFSPQLEDYLQQTYLLKFPAPIDAYSTIDINPRVRLLTKGSRVRQLGSPNIPNPSSPEYSEFQKDFAPLEVEYLLRLSSGQTVRVPRIICIYVSK